MTIASRSVSDSSLTAKDGGAVAKELGGRLLIRYMLWDQVAQFTGGSTVAHWVTPTPLSIGDLSRTLALPAPRRRRKWAMLLDPREIPEVLGPRWVRWGHGIEYVLPTGFPAAAIASRWEIEVT